MKVAIYADNFRGFRSQYLELWPVTFFVGENSSGKSSMLALAHLLMSDDFWISPNFNSFGHHLGTFADMVSKISPSKKSFTIGIASPPRTGAEEGFSAVIGFGQRHDSIVVNKCVYLRSGKIFSYGRAASGFWWSAQDCQLNGQTAERIDLLRELVRVHSSMKPKFAKLIAKKSISDKYLLLVLPGLIAREIESAGGDASGADDFILPQGLGEVALFAPIRVEARKFYEKSSAVDFSPSGAHTPYVLKEVLKKGRRPGFERSAAEFLEAFGEASGLFEKVRIRDLGRTSASPFTVEISIGGADYHLGEVGYGVSQILPIATELFAVPGRLHFFMQQPEVHLHPKAQAEIGNLLYFYSANVKDSLLVVETHSDYTVDRLRYLIRSDWRGLAAKVSAQVVWFDRQDGVNKVFPIAIGEDGSLPEALPPRYRDFFIKEDMRGLGIDPDH